MISKGVGVKRFVAYAEDAWEEVRGDVDVVDALAATGMCFGWFDVGVVGVEWGD